MISAETKQLAIRYYKDKRRTIEEIGNLTNINPQYLSAIFREAFKTGELTPRNSQKALKHRTPNGQGTWAKTHLTGTGQGNKSNHPTKFSAEQEQKIAEEYYAGGKTVSQIKAEYNIHPVQLQRIRQKYGAEYGQKRLGRIAKI